MSRISAARKIFPILFMLCLVGASFTSTSWAQIVPDKTAAATPVEEVKVESDLLGRDTPRGTMQGFLKAVAEENYVEAAQYMDISALSRTEQTKSAVLAQNLQKLLDRQGWIQPDGSLSNDPEGQKDDDLAPDLDNIASLHGDETVPIEAQRVTDKDGKQIWLISADFVERIPELSGKLAETPIDRLTKGKLDSFKVYGAGIGQWVLMAALYALAYLLSGMIVRLFIRCARWVFRNKRDVKATSERRLIDEFETPLRLYSMIWIASLASGFLGVSVIVRHAFMPLAIMIAWIAIGLFFWRLADFAVSAYERRMAARERYNMTSALAFTRRGLRFLVVLIIIILILNSFGVDVTAGLAALGIGGIALALGAQKTLENFIGSLSIIADQPLHIGDFCKIGDVSGTVEDIGMRSTRLRTNDRTLVTIPNGDLSTQRIENFARRSRFLINQTMVLRYDATPDRIRQFMDRCNDIFKAQEKIVHEGTIVRFLGFGEMGYTMQLWANVNTGDYNIFVAVQADIMLQIIDTARQCNLYFAIPSQTFLPAKDQTGTATA